LQDVKRINRFRKITGKM